jgi:hypothetical protein
MPNLRRGITLAETTVAMVLLTAAIVAVAQLTASVAAQRRVAHRQATARLEVANQMEHLFALPWQNLNEENVAGRQLSAASKRGLPDPELSILVGPAEGEPAQRRIRVEVSWRDVGDRVRRTAGLTAWRYSQEEAQP